MLDINGKLVTNGEELKTLTMGHYQKILENRPIKDDLINHQEERENLYKERIKVARQNITEDWTENNVMFVINFKKRKNQETP